MAAAMYAIQPVIPTTTQDVDMFTTVSLFTIEPNTSLNASNSTQVTSHNCWGHSDSTDIRIILIIMLVFIIIGVIGNTLSVLVFSSRDMRSVSSHVYLLILACSDMGYLLSVFFVKVLPGFRCSFYYGSTFDPYNNNLFGCVFFQFTIDLFADFSSCLILAFTIERFLAVYRPADYRTVCTTYRAKVISIILVIIITALILPYHIMFMKLFPQHGLCAMSKEHQKLFSTLYFTEAIAFRIIPVVLIAAVNALVVRHFRKANLRASIREATAERRARRVEATRKLTKILFLVSSTYIISYLPSLIHFLLWKMHRHGIIKLDDKQMTSSREYVNLLYIMGFVINFFLYTVSGPMFRQSLVQLLGFKKCRRCWLLRALGCRGPSRQSSLVQTDQFSRDELQTNRPSEYEEEYPLNKTECNGAENHNHTSQM